MIAAGHSEAFEWIESRTGCVLTRAARAIKAVDSSGRIRGVIAYDCWTETGVQAHMAVDSPVVWRSLVRPAFAYPFLEVGKSLIMGVIPADNERSCRMARRLGFRESSRVVDGWDTGVDLVIHTLRRHECRWLEA